MKKKQILKSSFLIKSLSIIAFICTALSCCSYFFYYDSEKINGEWVYELTYSFPSFGSLIALLLTIIPMWLFLVYIFKFYSKLKGTILVPIILGLFSFDIIFESAFSYIYWGRLISFIIKIPVFILCILGIISALKGLKRKISIIVVMVLSLLTQALNLISFIQYVNYYIEDERYLYLLVEPLRLVGFSCFYIAFLLFSIRNRIPLILANKKKTTGTINPERELKVLKDKFELGMITEEEYNNERAYIVSKL